MRKGEGIVAVTGRGEVTCGGRGREREKGGREGEGG